MNIKTIISVIFGIILLNNSIFTIIPLPGIISTIAVIGAAILLLLYSTSGGILGKVSLALGIIIGIYALAAILSLVGISIPFISFIYRAQRLAFIAGGALLIIKPFVNF